MNQLYMLLLLKRLRSRRSEGSNTPTLEMKVYEKDYNSVTNVITKLDEDGRVVKIVETNNHMYKFQNIVVEPQALQLSPNLSVCVDRLSFESVRNYIDTICEEFDWFESDHSESTKFIFKVSLLNLIDSPNKAEIMSSLYQIIHCINEDIGLQFSLDLHYYPHQIRSDVIIGDLKKGVVNRYGDHFVQYGSVANAYFVEALSEMCNETTDNRELNNLLISIYLSFKRK